MATETKQIEVGSIFYNSWGYEQTNIDFYQVVKVSPSSIWIRELKKTIVYEGDNYTYEVLPDKGNFMDDKVLRKRRQQYIPMRCGLLYLWEEKPMNETKYY